jgi:AcrR family transcriptional regulator
MDTNKQRLAPRERILITADELFFRQGFRATGINQVIAEAGVARATFFSHFPTKEALCLAYLQDRNTSEYEAIHAFVQDHASPRARFLAVMAAIEPWLIANSLRGCVFLNMVAEIPDPVHRLRQEGRSHYDRLRRLLSRLAQDLISSDPERYRHADADRLADDYLVILGGAIAMSEIYHDLWPARQGMALVERLIS